MVAALILILGIGIPEWWKRRRLAELERERESSPVVLAIARLEARLTATTWEACMALLAVLITINTMLTTIVLAKL